MTKKRATKKPVNNTITIQNVGPIRNLEFPVAPGVTVLRGKNEVGKSTAVDAVGALTSGKTTLEATDGQSSGIIQGPGVTLMVSRHSRNSTSGTLEVDAVGDKIDLSGLVDPPLKDGSARTRARIKALLLLTQATVPEESWEEHDQLGVIIEGDIDHSDPVTTHGKIKRRLEAAARIRTDQATQFQTKALQLRGAIDALSGDAVECGLTSEQANEQRRQADRELDGLLESRRRWTEASEQFEQDKERYTQAIEAKKEADAAFDQAIKDNGEWIKQEKSKKRVLEAANEELTQIRAKVDRLDNEYREINSNVVSTNRLVEILNQERKAHRELAEAASLAVPDGPSDDEIARARERVSVTENVAIEADNASRIDELVEERQTIIDNATAVVQESEAILAGVRGLDTVLANAIDSPYFTLVNGDLNYTGFGSDEDDRGPEPFDRLSDGKRWAVAIAAVAHGLSADSRLALVGVCQTAWEALDSGNRARVVKSAVEANLCIVTAEHNDNETLIAETV